MRDQRLQERNHVQKKYRLTKCTQLRSAGGKVVQSTDMDEKSKEREKRDDAGGE